MPSLLRNGGSQDDEFLLHEFFGLWAAGEPCLEAFWRERGQPENLVLLVGLIKIDIRHRIERGQSVTARDYLDRFPELVVDAQRVVSLVYEEFCLREEQGEDLDVDRFCDPYEPWRDSLLSQLGYHRQLSQVALTPRCAPRYPKPGERFSDYTLDSILGRGGSAQVYLATDQKLDRKVVLKITGAEGREASILAHLQHPNIVSVLSKIDSAETGLKGFSMLYCPGITLDRFIKLLRPDTKLRTARELRDLLRTAEVQSGGTPGDAAGWKDFPINGTFHDAMAWITLGLANALTHAHREKVLHRDVKPANILLAYSEGPKLFDFNLADDPRTPEEARAAQTGGTLPYMAPEQLNAFVDPRGWDQVGGPADVYSLGLVLREVLVGKPPETPAPDLPLSRAITELLDHRCRPPASLRAARPDVPPALDSILGRCLEPSLTRRYRSSSELAEDLHRFLERRPLKHAPNTSLREWFVNLFHRNRPAIFATLAVVLVLVAGWFGGFMNRQPFHRSAAFRAAVADLDAGRFAPAEAAFAGFDRDHPGSGYAKLYLALTLEKSGQRGHRLYDLLDHIPRCGDAEDAIRQRLGVESHSTLLQTELAWLYMLKDRARAAHLILKEVCRRPDASYVAFALLSDTELTEDHSTDSVRSSVEHLGRAIDLARAEGHEFSQEMLSTWNQKYLSRLMKLYMVIDEKPLSDESVMQLADVFTKAEDHLKLLDFPWSMNQVRDMGSKEFCFNYFGGLIAMGRARLYQVSPAHARLALDRGKTVNWRDQGASARTQLRKAWDLSRPAKDSSSSATPRGPASRNSPTTPFHEWPFLKMLQGLGVDVWV